MEGISIIHDQTNKKRYLQIDLDKYGGEYLQDFIDGLVANSRKHEESVPLEKVLEELKAEGKIDG